MKMKEKKKFEDAKNLGEKMWNQENIGSRKNSVHQEN